MADQLAPTRLEHGTGANHRRCHDAYLHQSLGRSRGLCLNQARRQQTTDQQSGQPPARIDAPWATFGVVRVVGTGSRHAVEQPPGMLGSDVSRTATTVHQETDIGANAPESKRMSIKLKRFRAQPMSRLLNGRGELGDLMRMARLIEKAQQHLREQLPPEFAEHLFVGGYQSGRLTLITDGAAWLTRLRYEQPRLLELLHQLPEFQAVTGFHLKVRPVRPARVPPRQFRHLSSGAGDEISSCAADVDDPKLKKALERLASHAQKDEEER